MFRLPNINHPTDSGKIQQIADFLFQFIRQLNMEQNSAESTTSASTNTDKVIQPVDYVVEQGTSGIWTYRKWASGIVEFWGIYSVTMSKATGDSYEIIGNMMYPFALKKVDNVQVSNEGGYLVNFKLNFVADDYCNFLCWTHNDVGVYGVPQNLHISITGRWK